MISSQYSPYNWVLQAIPHDLHRIGSLSFLSVLQSARWLKFIVEELVVIFQAYVSSMCRIYEVEIHINSEELSLWSLLQLPLWPLIQRYTFLIEYNLAQCSPSLHLQSVEFLQSCVDIVVAPQKCKVTCC